MASPTVIAEYDMRPHINREAYLPDKVQIQHRVGAVKSLCFLFF